MALPKNRHGPFWPDKYRPVMPKAQHQFGQLSRKFLTCGRTDYFSNIFQFCDLEL